MNTTKSTYTFTSVDRFLNLICWFISFVSGKIFEEDGCYDFDVFVDELFDTARSIAFELDQHSKKHDEKELIKTKQKLIRLLHVFILPALKLQSDELSDLQKILSLLEHQHANIERMIGRKDKTKYNIENSLREQRIRLVNKENFTSQQYVAKYDRDFLEIFLKHLQKDISISNDKLLTFDKEIVPLRNSIGEDDVKKLKHYRTERDNTLAYLNNALEARETIKNVISRPHITHRIKLSKRPVSQPFHVIYVEVAQRLQDINREIQDLIKTKIKISSVREATLLAIDEISEDGQSFGFERKAGKFEYETDIYDPKNKPEEWATLSEKIADLLKAKPLGFRDSHEKFCRMIKLKSQSLFDDSKLFSPHDCEENRVENAVPISPDTAHVLDLSGRSSLYRRSPKSIPFSPRIVRYSKSRNFSSRFSFGSIPKEATEAICKEIISHISEMTETLAVELYKKPVDQIQRSVINKIYICYESHVSTELMPLLHQLYEQSYRQQCDGLSRWISQISLSEIGFDDNTFQTLTGTGQKVNKYEASDEETDVKVPFDERRKRISFDSISKLSIDELYEISNREDADRQTFLSCAPGMDDWIQVYHTEDEEVECNLGTNQNLLMQNDDVEFISPSPPSPTNSNIARAENLIEKGSDTHEITPIVTDLPKVNRVDFQGSKLGHGDSGIPVANPVEPPPYEEVVMRRKRPSADNIIAHNPLPEEDVTRRHTPPPEYSADAPEKAAFFEAFADFEDIIRKESEIIPLFKKLRQMTQAIQYIERQVTKLRDVGKTNVLVCTDDILDIIVLLLSKMDCDTFLKLYAHMNLMIHLSPTFMHGNAHDYALVTINVAYQHMFEQHVLSQSPKDLHL